jgi:hypothetical protein
MRVHVLLLCSVLRWGCPCLAGEESSPAPRLTLITRGYSGRDARVEALLEIEISRQLNDQSALVLRPRIWLNSSGWSRSSPRVISADSRYSPYLLEG